VLSTPPAFVLSQDQTLRGKFITSGIRIDAGFSGRPLFSFQGTEALGACCSKKNAAELKPGGIQPSFFPLVPEIELRT
jgi:hypothetical protein